MNLSSFNNNEFNRGVSLIKEMIWVCCNYTLLSSFIPGSVWRSFLLKSFGANIGRHVVLRPRLYIKFPWRLIIEDNCWIGENVWIDNLDNVIIRSDSCISQGVYFCTGSHDWSKSSFDLIIKKIEVESHVWIGAFSRIGPGVKMAEGSVCSLGSVLTKSTGKWEIWAGNPCVKVKDRPRC